MHNLTEFLSRNVHWFLFIILEIISGVLLFRFNSYQASVWFTSANYVAGIVYEQEAKLLSFFSLRENNELLTKRNLELEQQLKTLSNQLYDQTKDSTYLKRGQFRLLNKYHLIQAKVVANSLDRPENLMTIDRGSADGVKKDMGVACGNGVVGIVYLVNTHYSVVIPVRLLRVSPLVGRRAQHRLSGRCAPPRPLQDWRPGSDKRLFGRVPRRLVGRQGEEGVQL